MLIRVFCFEAKLLKFYGMVTYALYICQDHNSETSDFISNPKPPTFNQNPPKASSTQVKPLVLFPPNIRVGTNQ